MSRRRPRGQVGNGCALFLVIIAIAAFLSLYWWFVLPAVALFAIGWIAWGQVVKHQHRQTRVIVREGSEIIYEGHSPIPSGVIRPGHDYQIDSSGPYTVQ